MRPHSNQYGREIEQAKRNMQIYLEAEKNMGPHENPHRGETWASMRARLFTPEELAASDKRVQRILKKVDEREARERAALARQAQVGTRPAQREQRAAVAGA